MACARCDVPSGELAGRVRDVRAEESGVTIGVVSSAVSSSSPRPGPALGAPSAFSSLLLGVRPRPRSEQLATQAPASPEPWLWRAALGSGSSEVVAPGVAGSPRIAQVEALRQPERAAAPVELRVTRDLGLTLTRSEGGLSLVLEAAPLRAAPAEAELPRIVAALRARGITVAEATVRTTSRRPRPR